MVSLIRISVSLWFVTYVHCKILLQNTADGLYIENYDCFIVLSLQFCRRPKEPIALVRNHETRSCEENGGKLHRYSELRSKNSSPHKILYEWKSSVERAENYLDYVNGRRQTDSYICECLRPSTFGKNCEYQLLFGESIVGMLDFQMVIRNENMWKIQAYGDIICYDTLECDSGHLCLDWRDICDGIQQCMSGKDEENCDLLKMNQCDADEYRCLNGMCIPNQFFLDGEFDCLDWSDEIQFEKTASCSKQRVNTLCDDHICLEGQWSCGDGQCIMKQYLFRESSTSPTCLSGRDRYFICEFFSFGTQWTLPNGRCHSVQDKQFEILLGTDSNSFNQQYEYLLKCSLLTDKTVKCPCSLADHCIQMIRNRTNLPFIMYPRKAILAPFLYLLFSTDEHEKQPLSRSILLNGTIRCGDSLVTILKTIPFSKQLTLNGIINSHFCQPSVMKIQTKTLSNSTSNYVETESIVQLNKIEMEVKPNPARYHCFRCSLEQPICHPVTKLGDKNRDCNNTFDEMWFGTGQSLNEIDCNADHKEGCLRLRQYIEQSWTLVWSNMNDTYLQRRISFLSYCDTLWDLESGLDENRLECQRSWVCPRGQQRCNSGQCFRQPWLNDGEWDCTDATDDYGKVTDMTRMTLKAISKLNLTNQSYSIQSNCYQTNRFLCISSSATRQEFSCFNFSQIGDGRIDCLGAFDERAILPHCSQPSILGANFLCASTNTCIPYYLHCREGYRCPNRSDDELWCFRYYQHSNCTQPRSFVCFSGRCLKNVRCNFHVDCPMGEDEYMCDYASYSLMTVTGYREHKHFSQRLAKHTIRIPEYRLNTSLMIKNNDPLSINNLWKNLSKTIFTLAPYGCNRGLGVLRTQNQSFICFCPPQYYGDKCQYHADRLLIQLFLNFSNLTDLYQYHSLKLLKLVLIVLYENETLMFDQFDLQLSETTRIYTSTIETYFTYPRSPLFRQRRRDRFFNRCDLLSHHPYSLQIELYKTVPNQHLTLISSWKYPILFDYLPVFKFAKILHLNGSIDDQNPCLTQPCHPNEQCQQLMNERSAFICLCKANFTGTNCSELNQQCAQGYCAPGSFCRPKSRHFYPEDPLPYCLCPTNRFGDRCSFHSDRCQPNPCLNNGTCIPDLKMEQMTCNCTKDFHGSRCEKVRFSINTNISIDRAYIAATIQFLEFDSNGFELILMDQQVFKILPEVIRYVSLDENKSRMPQIVLARLYESDEFHRPNLYLLSIHLNLHALFLYSNTEISPINQCLHVKLFSNVSSPIEYHQLCIKDQTRFCFRDDRYLCICGLNHTHAECFTYDDQSDRCSLCFADGFCLKGNSRRTNHFICICPSCHFGQQCEFNTKSFSFGVDQLLSSILISSRKPATAILLLLLFCFLALSLAFLSNLFSFVTLHQRSCLVYGVGHYLLWMSIINQCTLFCLFVRLLHITFIMTLLRSYPNLQDVSCKILNYLLVFFTRSSLWLPALVALERVYITIRLNGQWFRQPRIARIVMILTLTLIFLSTIHEFIFFKSISTLAEEHSSYMCSIEYPAMYRSMWILYHQIVSIIHFLLPLLINIVSTITVIYVVIRTKFHIYMIKWKNNKPTTQYRQTLIRNVFHDNRELFARPAMTLVPSIFSLFSVPLIIMTFSLECQNLNDSPLRILYIIFYLITFLPQTLMFYLYIYPSSFYWQKWQLTTIYRRLISLLYNPLSKITTFLLSTTENNTNNSNTHSLL